MMTPKELFQKNTELRDRWQAVAKADWFATVLVYALSQFTSQTKPTAETLRGAQGFTDVLMTLADPVEADPVMPSQVLYHQLDEVNTTTTKA